MKIFKSTLFVVLIMVVSSGLVHATPDESRFQTVEKLLTISSAAKTINESDNADAKQKQADAIELFEQAKTAADDGDGERAKALLGEATKMMFAATRMVKKKGDFSEKYLRDFDTSLASVEALRDRSEEHTSELKSH